MVALPHAEILMHDGLLAVVPFFREERDDIKIGDGVGDMRDSLRDVDAIAFADVEELFFSVITLRHDDRIAAGEQIVFVELGVVMIASYLALVYELEIEFQRWACREGR